MGRGLSLEPELVQNKKYRLIRTLPIDELSIRGARRA
jgi:hypothetical protein